MPVHLRLNDKDTSRNPFINFVTALPGQRHDEALRRLQQLAAMVKPLMKDQGFHINSLEEYEWNREFAGRCWSNGEVIELVLTKPNGDWIPLQYVLYVFCHELAHIKHMNHIPKLHGALTRHLKELALAKQSEGYYGDGLWSAGRSLAGGDFVSGLGMQQKQDNLLPEHVCGGAFSRTRAGRRTAGSKRRRRSAAAPGSRKFKGPSLHTGAQTAANTRGGNRRVQLDVDTTASGTRVDGRNHIPGATAKSAEYKLDSNSTFRKRTQSREARAKRANAALARFAQAASATGVKAEDDTKVNVKHEGDLRAAFSRQSSRATPTPGPSRRAPDEVELKAEAEYSSGTASDTDSNTEGEGSDADLVGNDLPGEVSANGNDGDRYTQGWRETAEQRRRRMTRFDDRQRGASEGNTLSRNDANEWSELLEDTSRSGETRTTQDNSAANAGASEKRPRLDIDTGSPDQDSNDSDNEIVFVAQQPGTGARSGEKGRQQDGQSATACASTSLTPAPENVAQTAHTSPIHRSDRTTTKVDRAAADTADWTCLLCTLRNPSARTRCEACDTSRGKAALGA